MIPCVSASELKRRIDNGERLVLLDVREPAERASCAIAAPATVVDLHIPMNALASRLDEIRGLASTPVVVYCHLGIRSLVAAHWLGSQGLSDLNNLDGGIDAWSVEVDPRVPRY